MTENLDVIRLKGLLRAYPNFPKPGIIFQDIFPIFQDHTAVESLITNLVHHINSTMTEKVHAILGLDARGFLFGPLIAMRLGCAFVPIRKKGKLPGECISASYSKEYGEDHFEMQADAVKSGQNVIIVDDLIATGGSAAAAGNLVHKADANILEYIFIVELLELEGRKVLNAPVYSLIRF